MILAASRSAMAANSCFQTLQTLVGSKDVELHVKSREWLRNCVGDETQQPSMKWVEAGGSWDRARWCCGLRCVEAPPQHRWLEPSGWGVGMRGQPSDLLLSDKPKAGCQPQPLYTPCIQSICTARKRTIRAFGELRCESSCCGTPLNATYYEMEERSKADDRSWERRFRRLVTRPEGRIMCQPVSLSRHQEGWQDASTQHGWTCQIVGFGRAAAGGCWRGGDPEMV